MTGALNLIQIELFSQAHNSLDRNEIFGNDFMHVHHPWNYKLTQSENNLQLLECSTCCGEEYKLVSHRNTCLIHNVN